MTGKLFAPGADAAAAAAPIDFASVTVCVVGIGRIGLPMALSMANSGIRTIGLDINEGLVAGLNAGRFPLKDEPGFEEVFRRVVSEKRFVATTDPAEAVPAADVVLLALPTSMDDRNVLDYSALRKVGGLLGDLLRAGSVVVVESTVEPGFVEGELAGIIEGGSGGLSVGRDVGLGVCPETANPGEIMKDFSKLPRLVGAMDERTAQVIHDLYRHVFPVELIRMPDCKTANAVKLTTNVFRDVNIAFVNELAVAFERLGIDVMTVLGAAEKKYNFQVHYPGAGVGGPCLPVCSHQLIGAASRAGAGLGMVREARRINEAMPRHVVGLVRDALGQRGSDVGGSRILVLGASYKPNVRDTQMSPAAEVARMLRGGGAVVSVYDPHYAGQEVFGAAVPGSLDEAARGQDAAVIVTAHDEFLGMDLGGVASAMRPDPVLVDARGVIGAGEAGRAGFVFRGLGRGERIPSRVSPKTV